MIHVFGKLLPGAYYDEPLGLWIAHASEYEQYLWRSSPAGTNWKKKKFFGPLYDRGLVYSLNGISWKRCFAQGGWNSTGAGGTAQPGAIQRIGPYLYSGDFFSMNGTYWYHLTSSRPPNTVAAGDYVSNGAIIVGGATYSSSFISAPFAWDKFSCFRGLMGDTSFIPVPSTNVFPKPSRPSGSQILFQVWWSPYAGTLSYLDGVFYIFFWGGLHRWTSGSPGSGSASGGTVGSGSGRLTSIDGLNWSASYSEVSDLRYYSPTGPVVYHNGFWFACGRLGLYSSEDGLHWSIIRSDTIGITKVNGLLYGISHDYYDNVYFMSSVNGFDWVNISSAKGYPWATMGLDYGPIASFGDGWQVGYIGG